MTKIGTGTVYLTGRAWTVRIPAKVRRDEDFPFEIGDEPTVKLVRKLNGKYKLEIEAED